MRKPKGKKRGPKPDARSYRIRVTVVINAKMLEVLKRRREKGSTVAATARACLIRDLGIMDADLPE